MSEQSTAVRIGCHLGRIARMWRDHPRIRLLVTCLLLALPVIFFLRHYLPSPSYVGAFGDIRMFHFWWDVSRRSLLEHGQLPYWNPYYIGGMVHWANVQTMFLSPTFLVNLLFGPGVGIRVHIFAHFIAGFLGSYALARQQGLKGLWALAPGVVFVFGANLAERSTGHLGFMPFLLLPWLLYFFDRARVEIRCAVPCALLVAYCVFAGAPYPFAFFILYLVVILIYAQVEEVLCYRRLKARLAREPALAWELDPRLRHHLRPVWIGLIIGGLLLLLPALKLFVVLDFMSEYPRYIDERDFLEKWQVWEVFLEAPLVRHRKGYFYVFGEYRNYLGPIAMLAVPMMLLRLRHHLRDYVLILVAGALMLGNLGRFSPFSLLAELPIFESLRVPVRYAILADMHVGILFGHLLARGASLAGRLQPPWRWLRPGLLFLLAVVFGLCAHDLMTNNNTQMKGFFRQSDQVQARGGPFRMIQGGGGNTYQGPPRNEGHLRAYETNPLEVSRALRANLPSEVYLASGPGQATLTAWTPNALTLDVRVPQPATVVVNMNFHRDWRAEGGEVMAWRGLLAARVPAGKTTLRLYYRPRRILLYAGMTFCGLVASVVLWRRLRPMT